MHQTTTPIDHNGVWPKFGICLSMIHSATWIVPAGIFSICSLQYTRITYGSNPKTLESGPLFPHGGGFKLWDQIWFTCWSYWWATGSNVSTRNGIRSRTHTTSRALFRQVKHCKLHHVSVWIKCTHSLPRTNSFNPISNIIVAKYLVDYCERIYLLATCPFA